MTDDPDRLRTPIAELTARYDDLDGFLRALEPLIEGRDAYRSR